ncbi:MAG: urate hydroxylase PuuD [Gammaproteobacteria bacterium]|nr:urate hydroxylase PuuD [Gammaproteobacteria bacterium]MCW8922377.1 urate hydroxylase PuuD [Gammaproteobacteria bacterium]
MNPLMTIKGTLAVGFILALAVAFGLGNGLGGMNLVIWLHVLAGVVWIGLLYYFNFVQVPGVGKALAEANDGGPGPAAINKYVAPTALLWFRMAAAVTWLTGLSGLAQLGGGMGGIVDAFMLSGNMAVIGLGAWLGTIMLFNVWVLIWPNQKKILGLDGKEHDADTIATAKKVALLASRTNTALSIPMLLCMVGYAHGMTF